MRFQSLFSWMFRPKPSFRRVCRDGNLFQSLFSWMFRPKPRLDPVPIQHEMFQSLFSWMFRPKLGYSAIRHSPRSFNPCSRGCFAQDPHPSGSYHAPQVSILVLVDVSPEGNIFSTMTRRSTVSILVLVDVSPEGFTRLLKPELSRVSILVLVDVSPEDMIGAVLGVSNTGFNPCSRGCFARSARTHRSPGRYPGFQSLFSWMFRPKFEDAARVGDFLSVSILVLVDVSPEGPQEGGGLLRRCFKSGEVAIPFQSLFSWMFRPKVFGPGGPARAHVSILVLVDVSPEAKSAGRRRTRTRGFNPCSRGCFARRWYRYVLFQRHRCVSILVLVDVSPEDYGGDRSRDIMTGFNPCSRGCFARSPRDRATSHQPLFQSLFSWMFRPKCTL